MASDAILSLTNVSYSYLGDWLQKIKALTKVTLEIPRGCAFGYLGANGAGKSTSIKLIVGLLHGHKGDIRLFGEPLGDDRLRRRIGYLPEQPYFYDNLEVGEYLTYLGRLSGIESSALPAACERVYEMLDLGDLRHRQLRSFSKGMRQRFGLAQAIIHSPDLLILDEPFSGLDPLWRARFREVMALERKRGATLFFSSHILSDVEDLCDYYGVIDHGVVLEQGKLADLMGQAPLILIGSGQKPDAATVLEDGTWSVVFPEAEREQRLASLPAGSSVLRLERQRIQLEDYFVNRVKSFHHAGRRLDGSEVA